MGGPMGGHCIPYMVLVVHGYDLTDEGGLGANELVCRKAVELWKSGKYACIILPAGVNEKTGEDRSLLWELHFDYLARHGVPKKALRVTYDMIASDTATEVDIARRIALGGMIGFVEVEAIGFFPHSYKVIRCWKKYCDYSYDYGYLRLSRVHHVLGFVGAMYWLKNLVSFGVGLFDPLGKHWPATTVKKRRRDLYTPTHLRDRVIF